MCVFVCLFICQSMRAVCDWSSLPPETKRNNLNLKNLPLEAIPLFPTNLPPKAMRENLYTTNLPPKEMREFSVSYKFTAGERRQCGTTSILQIYRRRPCGKISSLKIYRSRQCVNIRYPSNLPPEAM